jgi:hypothetical protein
MVSGKAGAEPALSGCNPYPASNSKIPDRFVAMPDRDPGCPPASGRLYVRQKSLNRSGANSVYLTVC